MSYDDLKPIVELIFNNWTALQLAVQHGMGNPGGRETAQLMVVYVARYIVENGNVNIDELTEVLEDIMDEEFDTNCCDNSPREIASTLMEFYTLMQSGRFDEVTHMINTMPKCEMWLSRCEQPQRCDDQQVSASMAQESNSSISSSDEDNGLTPEVLERIMNYRDPAQVAMEQDAADSEWTLVTNRRKK